MNIAAHCVAQASSTLSALCHENMREKRRGNFI